MLSRAQRIHLPAQFRRVTRHGVKVHLPTLVCYATVGESNLTRYGFIVSKNVGSAVTRNVVKRRLRAIAAQLHGTVGLDVVIRALPVSAEAHWTQLRSDFSEALKTAEESIHP